MNAATRTGFTLVEMVVVVAILGVVAGVTVPALHDAQARTPLDQTASEIARILARARRTAVERATPATMVVDPANKRYWLRLDDTVIADALSARPGVTIDASSPRLAIRFVPTGEAQGDTITVRWNGHVATIGADGWTGDVRVDAR